MNRPPLPQPADASAVLRRLIDRYLAAAAGAGHQHHNHRSTSHAHSL
jgi:hypothetical protein